MAEVIQDSQQEFWQSPVVPGTPLEAIALDRHARSEACEDCLTESMIGARFCHTCGRRRPVARGAGADAAVVAGIWARTVASVQVGSRAVAETWRETNFPGWLRYLHFHEIQRGIGLPTGSLIAFLIGLGCVAGVIGVSLFYKASNLAEFQAIQMWRIEWLLAATASFVAGILLKKPSDTHRD